MAEGASAFAVPPLKRAAAAIDLRRLVPVWSSAALMRAIRATIVVPGAFAFCDQVIGNLQMATFAAFGGFATLVLASFAGTRRDKLLAHLGLAIAGSVLLIIGTAINSSTALAAVVTLPVAFIVFFAGIAGPNAASGVTGALLAYVLPAASAGTMSMVPDRLIGWWIASVAGTAAVLLLSPRPAGDRLRAPAEALALALADTLDASLAGTASQADIDYAMERKHDLLAAFTATPYRPYGLATADQALANAIELLEWCTSLVADALCERLDVSAGNPADRDLLRTAASSLRDVVALVRDGSARPDLDELDRRREASVEQMKQLDAGGEHFRRAAQLAFHAQAIGIVVAALSADALVATGQADPDAILSRQPFWSGQGLSPELRRGRLAALGGTAGDVVRNASLRSVWFVNSCRGAVAIAAAVAIASLSNVQHGFWVVLGTLSVLRTNAGATGSTAIRALAGTVGGFVIGGALLLWIGTGTAALWVALPVAVFVAAYAPGTAPFAVGQAAFTVVVAVLFNLLVPVGWKVGVVRVQDVAIGCAVSVAVGILFWPRGASGVVGDDLADSFTLGAAYLVEAVEWACGKRREVPDGARAVARATVRLNDAIRGYLAEQGSKRIRKEELWRLIGGSLRLRLTALGLAWLPEGAADVDDDGDRLINRSRLIAIWYERLAARVDRPGRQMLATLDPPSLDSVPAFDPAPGTANAGYAIWVQESLHHLAQHLDDLVPPAEHIQSVRRRPWWR